MICILFIVNIINNTLLELGEKNSLEFQARGKTSAKPHWCIEVSIVYNARVIKTEWKLK